MSISNTLIDANAEPFLQYLLHGAPDLKDAEQRDNPRHPMSVTLLVQPLNADLQPDGEQFHVMTRDVSMGGFGFVHAEPIKQKYLKVLKPDQSRMELLVEVQHCTAIGELGLLYLTGVQLRPDLELDQRPMMNDVQNGNSVDRATMILDPKRQ